MTTYEDEIDLRPYLAAVFHYWWAIAGVTLLGIILGAALSLRSSSTFVSSATILVNRSRPVLSLATEFPTVSDPADQESRIDAMLTIGQSDAVLKETISRLMENGSYDPDLLEADLSRTEVTTQGDTILINAFSRDPDLSAQIANEYAGQMVEAINIAFRGEQPMVEIQTQLEVTWEDYQAAQIALEQFTRQDRIETITNRIEEARQLQDSMSFDSALRFAYYSSRKQLLEEFIAETEGLVNQLDSGTSSSAGDLGDAIAVLSARSDALGLGKTVTPPLNARLDERDSQSITIQENQQVDLPAFSIALNDVSSILDTKSNYVSDLRELVVTAREEKERIDTLLVDISEEVVGNRASEQEEKVTSFIQEMETELEVETAARRELESQRDVSWNAYKALTEKVTEIKNAVNATNQVTLASHAIPADKPSPRPTLQSAIIGGLMGFLLGTGFVLVRQWWRMGGKVLSEAEENSPQITP